MTAPTSYSSVAALAARKQGLIRVAQDAALFAAPLSADPIIALTTGAGGDLNPLPTGWGSLGHHTESDGIDWTRKVTTFDVKSHGSSQPTRRDITEDVTDLKVLAQESKRMTSEIFHSVDLSAVAPDATTHEIGFERAVVASTTYYRLLAIASDGRDDNLIYFARFCPRASVTNFGPQPWKKGEELRYEFTFTGYVDDTLGFAMREMWGGPGIADLLTDMGYTA
jgi:hypothetical protein